MLTTTLNASITNLATTTTLNAKINEVSNKILNPIQDGGAKRPPSPTSFSPVTSTNVGISP